MAESARQARRQKDSTRVRAVARPARSGLGLTSTLLVVLAMTAAGGWAYSTSFGGVFVYDDGLSIVDNPHIKTLWPLAQAMSAPPEATVSGRPVASFTLALNYALAPADARDVMAPVAPGSPPDGADRFARNIWGYHAFNLVVHLCAALALFGIVRRSLVHLNRPDYSTPLAFIVALIWLVHPLQTQAVTYVVQRVESLMGLFYLLTLYCAIRAADEGPAEAGHHEREDVASAPYVAAGFSRTFWTASAIAACGLGMATKEVMVTAPILVWLWDVTFGVDVRCRRHLYAGLAATWLILILLVTAEHRPQSVGLNLGWTWWSYLETQAAVIVHYMRLAVVPTPLVFDYDWPRVRSLTEVWPQAALLTAFFCATVLAVVKRHPLGFLGAWFFLILAPTSSVLPIITEVAAEHRMYLPLAAIISAAIVGAYDGGRRLLDADIANRATGQRVAKVLSVVAAASIALTFAEMTRASNRAYWSDEALWIDTIEKRPSNARARVGYGIDLLAAGKYAEAEQQLRIAVSLDDSNGRAHMNLGSALCAQGKLAEGIPHLERALALNPALNEAYGLLGEAYAGTGNHVLAATYLRRAVEALPNNGFLLNRAAWLLATSPEEQVRNGMEALDLAERAVRVDGQNVLFLDTLAAAYAEQNRFADAAAVIRRALPIARAQGQARFASELEGRLALYAVGRKLRVSAPQP